MAMHLELLGGRFVAAMAVLLAVAGNAAFAQEHKTYRCKVADAVSWGEDGRLRPDSNPREWMRQIYDGVIIDTLTGAVAHPDGHRAQWNVINRGDDREYDYMLTKAVRQDVVNQFIRIRTWGGMPRFLASFFDSFASGPCEVVR